MITIRRTARTTDPQTSHEAGARTPEEIKGVVRQLLYTIMAIPGGRTDEEAWESYEHLIEMHHAPKITAARLRHCRLDLVEDGLLIDSGLKRRNESGSKAIVWAAP